ncbi:MAG TPA: DEAD/DEAH box helicase, partial [Propylenella sp.]|nr:DEAD/DEAH box helicase [Propylenella sp.]
MADALVQAPEERDPGMPVSELAARLVAAAEKGGALVVARSERRASLLARTLAQRTPSLDVLRFPAWDCVPYDRASPSRHVMGRRVSVLKRLVDGDGSGFVVVATPEALAQRVPPRAQWPELELCLRAGDALDIEPLESFLLRTGYVLDERVDEAGEAAIRGAVIDIFPAGTDEPVRLDHADGRITGIRRYDAASQRTLSEEAEILLLPTSEVVLAPPEAGGAAERFAGIEHFLPDFCGPLETLFDFAPQARTFMESGAEERYPAFWHQVEDAYETRRATPRDGSRTPPAPKRLYVGPGEWAEWTAAAERIDVDLEGIAAPRDGALTPSAAANALGITDAELRLGDAVVHLDHGMARLAGIETVAAGGAAEDALVLEFADEAKLLVPVEEIQKIWCYGGEADAVTLDRLHGAAWPKRREALQRDLETLAQKLIAMARERADARAPKILVKKRDYERFADAFPFAETQDQARAIADVLADLASGRRMDRLVCGDVGFGKTEVALRAAAATVLAGRQVAVAAPTTVLVRQHVQTFGRRFAAFGIEVAHLSRLVGTAEARAVRQGIAAGDTRILIGTHALAGKGVQFQDLGLLIIDEEQRFGAKQKEKLRGLGRGAHVLTLTATPIPRTLEWA